MEPIENLVPHSGKMLLLSRVHSYDIEKRSLSAEVDISKENLFYDQELGGVPVWIGFEYMAQSIGALSGLYNSLQGISPKIGFILSVIDYKPSVPYFLPRSTVRISVQETVRFENAVTFECSITQQEKILATSFLNALEVQDIAPFIEE